MREPLLWWPVFFALCPPGGNDEISIEKCRKIAPYLVGKGFKVRLVTYDQYQSRSSLQLNVVQGIPTEQFSMDRNDDPWKEVANRIYQRRQAMYAYPPLKDEWFALQHDRVHRKVDHPKDGSKDVCDAFGASSYHAWMSVASNEAMKGSADKMNMLLKVMTQMRGDQVHTEKSVTQSFFGKVRVLH